MLIRKSHASSVLRSLFNLVLRTIEEIQASHYKNVHKTRHLKVGLQTWLLLFTQTQMKYNLNQILTLLWQLIMHYQMTEANQGSEILFIFLSPQEFESVSAWSVADLKHFRPFWDRLDLRHLTCFFLSCCCDTGAEKLVMSLSGRQAFIQSSRSISLPWFASVTW